VVLELGLYVPPPVSTDNQMVRTAAAGYSPSVERSDRRRLADAPSE